MSVADLGKVYVFSAMSGTILNDGKPVAGLELRRTAGWQNEQSDSVITDENGKFSLPAMTERSVKKYLPQEFAAEQKIKVSYQGEEITIWSGVKRKPEENIEARGKPIEVICDISDEEKLITVNRGPIFSRCDWDVEPDEEEDFFGE